MWRGVCLALLSILVVAQCAPLIGDCALLELLPTDLTDSISFIQPDGQAHFQGEFFVDFQKENHHNITFDLKFNTTFRFYVAPHEIDIDLWLYPIDSKIAIAHSALDVAGAPEVIFGHLAPGGYRLTMFFLGALPASIHQLTVAGDLTQVADCPAVITEIEMIPDTILASRMSAFACPFQPQYPEIDFTALTDGYEFHFATTDLPASVADVLNVQSVATNFRRDVKWITAYNFTVPKLHGRAFLWQFSAAIGYQFLSGGSLGMLLVSNSSDVPDQRCYLDGDGCWLGSNLRMNEHVISEFIRPGDYQLWIFDQIGEKDPNIALPCTPFSLFIDVTPTDEEETMVNCPAKRLPSSLNGPDGIDEQGYYLFSNDVLLELDSGAYPTEKIIPVRPAFNSLIRIEASEALFDVDIALYNADTEEQLALSNRWAGFTDAIAYTLTAGSNYTVVLRFFTNYSPRFCETFPLDIAIAPIPSFDFCDGATPSLPDLSVLDDALKKNEKLKRVDYGPFYFSYSGSYEVRTIYQHNLQVGDVTNIKFVLGYNFLLGGLDISLTDTDTGDVIRGHQNDNLALLQGQLHAGTYSLQIVLSPIQTNYQTNLTGIFPPCLRYTLGFASVPSAEAAEDLCWHVLKTPNDLRDLSYLGSSSYVHIIDDFLIPDVEDKSYDEDTKIEVQVPSLLHVYTPARDDLDIRLTLDNEKGDRVATSNNQYAEEEIFYSLDANERYTLTVRYYRPRQSMPLCATYNLELLVEPLPSSKPAPPAPDACSTSPLPSNLLSTPMAPGWALSRTASLLLQKDQRASIDLPFAFDQPSYISATIAFPFSVTELSLYVLPSSSEPPVASSMASGDGSTLNTVLLPPGSYVLRIANPYVINYNRPRCVPFTLSVSTALVSSETTLAEPCIAASMPAVLNAVPFLSPIGGYSLHFTREVLVSDSGDNSVFELTTESLVRVFTSGHASVDIDVYLYTGMPGSENASLLAFSNGYGEELVLTRIPQGVYTLSLRYGVQINAPSVDRRSCESFTIEMAIAPMADLLDNADITQPCPLHTPSVTNLQPNTSYSDLQWLVPLPSADSQRFSQAFELRDVGYISADLRYDFLIGGLSLTLSREGAPAYDAEINMNHAYLRTGLPAGRYTLAITSNAGGYNLYGDVSFIRCGQFELDYLLNTTADPNFCDQVDSLPTDLFSVDGGSIPYGGPQSAVDGSVEIYGEHFLMHRGQSEADVMFIAPRQIFVRFFATGGAGSDLDFVLYSDANKTLIVAYSIGFEDYESSLFLLPAKATPYLLAIKFWRIPKITCPYYRFEAVIRDVDTVANDIRCPAYLPPDDRQVPPSSVTLDAGQHYETSSSDYVLTKARLAGATSRWDYLISLDLPGNTTLYSSVMFDFLSADFRLSLNGPEAHLEGVPDYADDRASEFDFENRLVAELPRAGVYTLTLRFQTVSSATQLSDYCFNFAFSLALSSSASPRPSVMAVEPPAGENLQASAGLTIRVSFSEQFAQVAATTDFTTVAALRVAGGTALIPPNSASPFANRSGLRFVWDPLSLIDGMSYTLVLHPDLLTATSSGQEFENYNELHVYSFISCDCNGHGQCVRLGGNGLLVCNCDAPYAGEACQACADGYHGVAGHCEADQLCTEDQCGPHGWCEDSEGVPRCFCNDGYATIGDRYCSVCAPGYVNFPNCTRRDEALEESTLCSAPVLPSTFDSLMALRDEVHLAGDYFIDVDSQVHDIDFSLKRDSVLRVYAEPHWIDVDLWLLPLHADGSTGSEIAVSLGYYTEEVLYVVLNGSTVSPPRYRLSLRYFIWSRKAVPTDCETLNVELALAPLETVQQQAIATADRLCPSRSKDVLPLAQQRNQTGPFLIPNTGFASAESTVYSWHAALDKGPPSDRPNFFWNLTFTVEEVPNTQILLSAQIDHQFLPSALALLLETGDNKRHCGMFGVGSTRSACIVGRNAYNRNIIYTLIPAGSYTLWIYEPKILNRDVAGCAPFNFAFNISYVPAEDEDIFNCDEQRLPLSLNAPGFMSPHGFIHFADSYLIEPDNAPVILSVANNSFLRVAASSPLPIYFFVRREGRNNTFVGYGLALHGSAQLAQPLPAGDYSLQFWSWDSAISPADAAFCVPTLVQIALAPEGHVATTQCPRGTATSRLPDLSRTRVPSSMPPTRFYVIITNRDTEASYNIRFEEDTQLDVAVTSDFVTAGIGVRLDYTVSGKNTSVDGEYTYNEARISGQYPKGSYTLRLLFPKIRSGNSDVCVPFDFSLSLQPVRSYQEPDCDGEPFPFSLDTLRYLGASYYLDYYASFRVPLLSDRSLTFTNITAPSQGSSAVHIFVDQPPEVSMQGVLHRLDGKGARTAIAPLVGGLIRAQIEANTTYQLELALSRQAESLASCVSVPIQWSIAPVALWPLPEECPPAARNHFPTIVPPEKGLFSDWERWNYSSVAIGESLYMQQSMDALNGFHYNFKTDALGRIYVAVGYDLRAGYLQAVLSNVAGERYVSVPARDVSVLIAENLSPGQWTLEISEAVPEHSEKRLTCLAFSLEIIIERDYGSLIAESITNELPASLNTVAFLSYSSNVHFAVNALFMRPLLNQPDPSVTFRLSTRSYVRVLVQRNMDFGIRVIFDGTAAPDDGAGALILAAGSHTISLQRTIRWQVRDLTTMWERDVQLGVEISITSAEEAGVLYSTGWVANTKDCDRHSVSRIPGSAELDDENHYQFTSSALLALSPEQQKTSQMAVHTVQFVLPSPCIVYAEVTYDPAYGDVAVRLMDSEKVVPPHYATVGQGLSVLHTVAPSEVYNLELYQPSAALGDDHCIPFSFRLVIHDAMNSRGELVCTDFNRLPFDISTIDGGSLAYGGPMEQGSVSLYGDQFLYPVNSDSDSVRVEVQTTTLMSVYFSVARGMPLNSAVYAPNATDPLAEVFADSSASTQRKLFLLDAPRGRKQAYTLTAEFPWARPLTACPYYTFALLARPLSAVQSALLCPRSTQPQGLPSLVPLSYGFAETQVTSSFAVRTDEVLPDILVNFTITNASLLVTSLAFDSLVFSAEIILQRSSNPEEVWTRAVVRASPYRSQPFDMEERLFVPLLQPDAYTLRIRRQVFPAIPFTAASLCLPFSWFFFVAPHEGSPYVLSDPPGGVLLRPESKLVIQLSMSSAPRNASGAPFTYANAKVFGSLFTLVPQAGSDPSAITLGPLTVQPTSEYLTWTLEYNGMLANSTYVLRLAPLAVFDAQKREFRQPATATYQVGASGCSEHGQVVVGECDCNEGYEGAYCESCAEGYHEQGSDTVIVCVPDGEKCAVESCGCEPNVAPCQPLGNCNDTSGAVVCSCFGNRAGRHCDKCLPGFGPPPTCAPIETTTAPPCPCLHGGTCIGQSTRCKCPINWTGTLCDDCADGYQGDLCDPIGTTTTGGATPSPPTTSTSASTTSPATSSTPTTSATTAPPSWSLTSISEIAVGVFLLVLVAGVAVVCWLRRRQQQRRRYADLLDDAENDMMLDERPSSAKAEKTITLGNEKVAVKNTDDEDGTFNPRSKNQDKMFEL